MIKMSEKPVKWAICTIRNEEECIIGAARSALYFAENVLYCVDPNTSDKTIPILKERFPNIIIELQDRSLGDSDNEIKGESKSLICHANLERMINKYVKDGEWVLMMAPDERFNIKDFHNIGKMIKGVDKLGYKGISFPSIHTFAPESNSKCIDYFDYYKFSYGSLIQIKFMKKNGDWHKGKKPHSGYDVPQPFFTSPYPMYHYCWLKKSRKAYKTWRDLKQFEHYPLYDHLNPMFGWRLMDYLNNSGEIINYV